MPKFHVLTASLLLVFCGGMAAAQTLSLSEQVKLMPEDFRGHFFNAPLSARVMLDGQVLGDAMLTLTEKNQVRLIQFTDHSDSNFDEAERQRWLTALSVPVSLGECIKQCPVGLKAADYSLSDARLVLISTKAADGSGDYWYTLPEEGDTGVLLNNQLNFSGSRQQNVLSWNGGLEAALGTWTLTSQFQHDQTRDSDVGETISRHAMTSLYAQRELQQSFIRAGLFMPNSQGLLRQPYMISGGISTLAGVMAGSSDSLLKSVDTPALYPVYVTANREGVAEVYRDGTLLNAQPVIPGLQMLDTTPLPRGIYEVDIRILEDGREISRTTETINKPIQWRIPGQRVRYNVFAGQQHTLLNSDSNESEGDIAVGGSINYLLLPQITTGLAWQKIGDERQEGASVDWQIARPVQLYSNIWHSSLTGYGFDTQGIWTHSKGNIALSHTRNWYRPEQNYYSNRPSIEHNSTLSSSWRIDSLNSVNSRVNYNSRTGGIGVDAGFNTQTTLAGTPVNWRLSGFDRPYGESSTLRNRGVNLSANFSLGGKDRSGNLSLGSRTASNGDRDFYTSASINQSWAESSPITMTTLTVTGDSHGAGFSTYNHFDTQAAQGNIWAQSSTIDGRLSGGLNTGSLLAWGKGKLTASKQVGNGSEGGVIINITADDKNTPLVAHSSIGSVALKHGRNFVPVEAWKPGTIHIDFADRDAPALKVQPEYIDYHHIPGGVSSREVRVMKTITVMGRLVDPQGQSIGGAIVVNHAGKTMTQSDGMFTVDVHEHNPVLKIEHQSGIECEIRLLPEEQKKDDMIFAGNLMCEEGIKIANLRDSQQEGV